MEAILEILKQIPRGVVAAIFLNGGLATLAYFIFWKKDKWKQPGFVFGSFLVLIFFARFVVEFINFGKKANR